LCVPPLSCKKNSRRAPLPPWSQPELSRKEEDRQLPSNSGPLYLRGEAYLDQRDGAKALAEFQKIADHRGHAPTSPLYSLARLGSARAYALQGDAIKAKSAYQDFIAAWKDADPDVPILKQAKAEYAKLQ
jgi:tetratricopeptide (TPR) repeat protein